ncbi:hypothetical protein [Flavobacterium sp. N3904]|uniref:hypothetical protein n=1 Tax=Flavobacterium sp. N3904 TaxID=2986835 RepID=UPI00222520E2|nr:hypothetical protein [Flavobacterium sp. N3904]
MKKATLTIGLFTVVTALTSFANPIISTSKIIATNEVTSIDGTGNQSTGGNRKVDYNGNGKIVVSTIKMQGIDGTGNQSTGGNRKVD